MKQIVLANRIRGLLVVFPLLSAMLLSSGCSTSMRNVDIDPPTSGILHYLQQSSMANVSDNGYQVQATAIDGTDRLVSGSSNVLSLRVLDPSGQPVSQFTEDMTKLMHLIIVKRDLSTFQHLHPDYKGDGRFEATTDFPVGGEYLLIEEFMPDDQPVTVTKQWVSVPGKELPAQQLHPSSGTVQTFGGVSAAISVMPDLDSLRAGQMVMIEYHLTDEKTGEPLQLEPYLGTAGHCVILNEQADQYVHVHAISEMSSGSNVMFHTEFPAAGKYRIWGQFQYQGEVIVIPFDVEVQP